MKIIMNGIDDEINAAEAFIAVRYAIRDNIKIGRNNFYSYKFSSTNTRYNVCKNKNSFTVYCQRS
jgi:hypothetical protein